MLKPVKTLNPYDILDALNTNDFNLALTAEKLKLNPSEVLSYLTPENESVIAMHMRTRMTLEMYTLWKNVLPFLIAAIADAEPKDVIKAFGLITEGMSTITKQPATPAPTNNINQVVLNMLPPSIREAVLSLQEDSPDAIDSEITQRD